MSSNKELKLLRMKNQSIILFDGVCNLCNASVRLILKYERKPNFHFATLQSDTAKKLLSTFKTEDTFNSVLLISNNQLYQKSTAALLIAKQLKYFRHLGFLLLLPTWMRDPFYMFISRYRYKIFGRKNQCMIPEPGISNRFI